MVFPTPRHDRNESSLIIYIIEAFTVRYIARTMLPVIFLTAFIPFCLSSTTPVPLDVVGVLAARSSESILVDLIKTAGLADALSQGGEYA